MGQGIHQPTQEKEGEVVKCGVCEGHYGELLVSHAELCEDDRKAPAQRYSPELDDLIRSMEEDRGGDE